MPGFIPFSRASLMLDVVTIAMAVVLPIIAYAISLAKSRRYVAHKKVMTGLSAVLLIAVAAFEIEMRLIGWTQYAQPSPYYNSSLPFVLGFHIVCSSLTALGLVATIFTAHKRFPTPPQPGPFSATHKKLGKLSAVGLFMTSVTGWIFYWMAFVAT